MAAEHPVASLGEVLDGLTLDSDGNIEQPLVIVDLDPPASPQDLARAADAIARSSAVFVGVASQSPDPAISELGIALDCTLIARAETAPWQVAVPDPGAALARIGAAVATAPIAAVSLARLLRRVEALSVADGLAAESSVYSTLLGGTEFRTWLSG